MSPVATHTPSAPAQPVGGKAKFSTQEIINLEHEYSAHNYHPLPVCFERGEGAHVWDPEGNEYLDFLAAYSAVNQGHCHPDILNTLITQASKLTLSSRAFYSSNLGPFAEKITKMFGFEMVLPMNTGAEAVETAIKLARKWGYEKKKIPEGKAKVLSVDGNFHGRTIGIISMSTDPESRAGFGPFLEGVGPNWDTGLIRYNHPEDLERTLEKYGDEVAAFLVEPIQGEAGIYVPDDGYLAKIHEICKKYNVLLICDEIQTGLARTGKMLCYEWDGIKPDMVILGKALSGGMYPVSCVMASKEIMLTIKPGEHGSTYGGNPLGCAVAMTALDVLVKEDLVERSAKLGELFRYELRKLNSPFIKIIRGRGLFNGVVIDEKVSKKGRTAWQLCLLMKSKGLLAKPTHVNIIRFAPPLVISEEDIIKATKIIAESLEEFDVIEKIPGDEGDEHDTVIELED
ncbi:ornithine-oxo-acid transaminase [Kwoniella shivajii]|uniref:Ornithine aminotransferase n=1 Tax=Kwoniella shivajii TaxID=564305 RepID=A0ABZ1CZ05_9TREE|nr:ornithine-oxo-acid transaminase [Kwoniella shivajii]